MRFESMEDIYDTYHNELYLYALSLSRNEQRAKDLVSETFYKVLLASNHPDITDESFKYWLFRVLKNHFIDEERKRKESLTFDKHKPFIASSSVHEPQNEYLKNERNQRLYHYLMNLEPIIYREVIYLYYFAEMSIREIAQSIDRTETNTKIILYRARKKLGRQLKEDPYAF